MQEERVLSKKGIPLIKTTVVELDSVVPEEFKGRFLSYDWRNCKLVSYKVVRKTPEEIEQARNQRREKNKSKWQDTIKRNEQIKEEISLLIGEVKALRKDIVRKARGMEDVSALQSQVHKKTDQIDQLRAKKKVVPKIYKS